MISVRFDTLRKLCLFKPPDATGAGHQLAHVPEHAPDIDRAIGVLNEVEVSHSEQWSKGLIGTRMDMGGHQGLTYREVWRIGSYIVFACTLEGILTMEYAESCKTLHAFSPVIGDALRAKHRDALKTRAAEVADITLVRHKVFAHTSFGSPKHRGQVDSASTQLTSLLYFTGNGTRLHEDGLELGTMAVHVNGEHPPRLPGFRMSTLTGAVDAHLKGWHGMYADLSEALHSVPLSDIKAVEPWVEQVHWT